MTTPNTPTPSVSPEAEMFCPACGKRLLDIHTCSPQLHVSPALLRVAEACERAADTNAGIDDVMNGVQPPTTRHVSADTDTLRAHARAIREGRFIDTLEQEGTT